MFFEILTFEILTFEILAFDTLAFKIYASDSAVYIPYLSMISDISVKLFCSNF